MSTRYVLHDSIGSGGMATVHIGQLHAPLGFTRVVAIKRLHPALSRQPEFAAMLVDEARITARMRHLNVIPTLDVFLEDGECFLVMEYVEGESLAKLLRSASQAQQPVPVEVVSAVMVGVLHGLHAAHVAKSGAGQPLNIIHRDVSPQNILVGTDGIPRVFDFGVAKAMGRLQQTRAGEFKGKLPYLAPEQFGEGAPDRRVDVYAASVTLWEALTSRRLFDGASEEEVFGKILQGRVPAPSELRLGLPPALDELVLRGLSRSPGSRFNSAEEMALALERAITPARPREVAAWLESMAGEELRKRAALVESMDGGAPRSSMPVEAAAPSMHPAPSPVEPVVQVPPATVEPLRDAPSQVVPSTTELNPTVTQRMTMPLRIRPRGFPPPEASNREPAASVAPAADAPTLAQQLSSTPPPFTLATAEPRSQRRIAVRATLGAVALLCSLAAPAFGWMAFTDRDEPTPAAPVKAAALPPVAVAPRTEPPPVVATAVPRIADDPPSPRPSATPLPKPIAASTAAANKAAPAAKPTASPARPVAKAKPAASAPDLLSSRAYSQRR